MATGLVMAVEEFERLIVLPDGLSLSGNTKKDAVSK
jgi:hypothetical protein